jgi:uncharacterized protein YfeS
MSGRLSVVKLSPYADYFVRFFASKAIVDSKPFDREKIINPVKEELRGMGLDAFARLAVDNHIAITSSTVV